jgi:hypothetical protein
MRFEKMYKNWLCLLQVASINIQPHNHLHYLATQNIYSALAYNLQSNLKSLSLSLAIHSSKMRAFTALALAGAALAAPAPAPEARAASAQFQLRTVNNDDIFGWAIVNAHVAAGQNVIQIQRPAAYQPDISYLNGTSLFFGKLSPLLAQWGIGTSSLSLSLSVCVCVCDMC